MGKEKKVNEEDKLAAEEKAKAEIEKSNKEADLIEKTNSAAERLEKANAKTAELQLAAEKAATEAALAGKAEAGNNKPETDDEKTTREANEIIASTGLGEEDDKSKDNI